MDGELRIYSQSKDCRWVFNALALFVKQYFFLFSHGTAIQKKISKNNTDYTEIKWHVRLECTWE
jgi:hypothetical protein